MRPNLSRSLVLSGPAVNEGVLTGVREGLMRELDLIDRTTMKSLAGIALALLLNTQVSSEVLRVPEDYASILSAVDAASAGDSVLVGPGTWTDREVRLVQVGPNLMNVASCVFLKPGISVIGTSGAEQTIVDGGPEDVASQITFLQNLVGIPPVRVEGFTVHAGSDAFVVTSPSPIEIVGCRIEDCPDQAVGIGRAIGAARSKVILEDTIVRNCGNPGLNIGAIHGSLDCDLELRNSRFEANPAVLGAVELQDCHSITVEGCEFLDHPNVRAMSIVNVGVVDISSSLFLRNSSATSSGGALVIAFCQSGLIEFCTFAYDSAIASQGGALLIQDSNLSVTNCTFYRCHAPINAATMIAANVFGIFGNNVVANSTGGPALRAGGGDFNSDCNVFWANEGGDYSDWDPAPTDIFADPMFCDPDVTDFTVMESSPCLPKNSLGCGLIGALGQGCGTVSVESKSWGRIKGLYR